MSVIIVGAGVIGASISQHLAQRGAKVTLLESAPNPAAAATGKSWAWLNANYKKPLPYRDMSLQSMQLWRQQHPQLCTFCGTLMLHDERPADPQDPAYPCQPVPAEQLQSLEPALNPHVTQTLHHARLWPLEGWCDPAEATSEFLRLAQAQGTEVHYSTQVDQITSGSNSCGTTSKAVQVSASNSSSPGVTQQHYEADMVVIAAGVGSPALAAQLGYQLPLLHKPAAIVMTQPLQQLNLKHMVITHTGVFILQRGDGRCLLGETHPSEASNTDTSSENGRRVLELAAAAVPALQHAQVEGVHVGFRPFPADGYPVLGFIQSNVYVAVTHSGMTLAPLIATLVADEVMAVLNGTAVSSGTAEQLAPYRPSRTFEAAAAAGAATGNWAPALNPGAAGGGKQTV